MDVVANEPVKLYGLLQALEIVTDNGSYDLEVYGQKYKIPKSGVSKEIDSGDKNYKYDFSSHEVILLSPDGKEVFRKKIDPIFLVKSEWKWLKNIKEEARLSLGLDNQY